MEFLATVKKIYIKPHTNADTLELGNIGSEDGFQVVVKKDLFKSGDLVVYIGENAVVPEWILKKYGFYNFEKNVGHLAGKSGNRVKAGKLRKEFSLGICIPVIENTLELQDGTKIQVQENQDVMDILGIIKYEVPIPPSMSGVVYYCSDIGYDYDIENIERFPDVIMEGEPVQVTHKIHGTQIQIILIPNKGEVNPNHLPIYDGNHVIGYVAVTSKGRSKQGQFLKWVDENESNVYIRIAKRFLIKFVDFFSSYTLNCDCVPPVITIFGEVYGKGIQDLGYGEDAPNMRIFDILIHDNNGNRFVNDDILDKNCDKLGIDRVPVLYRGPYNKEMIMGLADYPEQVSGKNLHIGEGIVIKPLEERYERSIGRVAVKKVSERYRLRNGGTEYN